MDSALLSFFQQDKDLITDNRPLRLRLAHPTKMLEDVLLPQQVVGTESICGSLEYRILCVSLDAFIPLKELIALPIAVDIVTDRGDLRSICGIVTEARAGDSDGGLASYQLVMRDALSIMEKRTNTRVFRNRKPIACEGDLTFCPQCKGIFPIHPSGAERKHRGRSVAYNGDKAACGAKLLTSI